MHFKRTSFKRLLWRSLGLAIAFLCALSVSLSFSSSFSSSFSPWVHAVPLPALRTYPVPTLIQQSVRSMDSPCPESRPAACDYFDQIEQGSVGALIWSKFPVTVAIDPAGDERWQKSVRSAVSDWQPYFPLQLMTEVEAFEQVAEQANIVIRSTRFKLTRPPGSRELPRFRAAETRYILRFNADRTQIDHQMTIALPPGQADGVLRSAARHELGHAIGLWGHSPNATDVMYFSQVKEPPQISNRDLRSLQRVYQQPTRLGRA